jgi:hypothetical protein
VTSTVFDKNPETVTSTVFDTEPRNGVESRRGAVV